MPYLLALLALVGLDHEFNNYDAQPFSLFAMMPLVLALTTCVPGILTIYYYSTILLLYYYLRVSASASCREPLAPTPLATTHAAPTHAAPSPRD